MWLGMGLIEDRDTDGHVDLIAAFIEPGRVLLQTVASRTTRTTRTARRIARASRRPGSRSIELPLLPYAEVAGEQVAASYLNFYICNRAVIVPVAGADTDAAGARRSIAGATPIARSCRCREPCSRYGGGGPHCITQQVPVRTWLKHQQLLTAYPPPPSPARTRPAAARAAAARARAGALAPSTRRARDGARARNPDRPPPRAPGSSACRS